MRKISIIVVSVALLATNMLVAQTKEEKALKKEWAKKMKEMDPLAFKKLVEDKDALSAQVNTLNTQVSDLNTKVTASEAAATASKEENEKLKADLAANKKLSDSLQAGMDAMAAQAAAAAAAPAGKGGKTTKTTAAKTTSGSSTGTQVSTSTSRGVTPGVVFKVQIGSFKNKDLSKYFENNKNFSGEIDADGTKKYTLGNFTEYWEADNFKKYLREMGVKDAWIVPYKDGNRVNIKDVLEGAI